MSSHQKEDCVIEDSKSCSSMPPDIQESQTEDLDDKMEVTDARTSIEHTTKIEQGIKMNDTVPVINGCSLLQQSCNNFTSQELESLLDDPKPSYPFNRTVSALKEPQFNRHTVALLPLNKRFSYNKRKRGEEQSGGDTTNLSQPESSNQGLSLTSKRHKRSIQDLAPGVFTPPSSTEQNNHSLQEEVETAIKVIRSRGGPS